MRPTRAMSDLCILIIFTLNKCVIILQILIEILLIVFYGIYTEEHERDLNHYIDSMCHTAYHFISC